MAVWRFIFNKKRPGHTYLTGSNMSPHCGVEGVAAVRFSDW
jgi:hypothetical protein